MKIRQNKYLNNVIEKCQNADLSIDAKIGYGKYVDPASPESSTKQNLQEMFQKDNFHNRGFEMALDSRLQALQKGQKEGYGLKEDIKPTISPKDAKVFESYNRGISGSHNIIQEVGKVLANNIVEAGKESGTRSPTLVASRASTPERKNSVRY